MLRFRNLRPPCHSLRPPYRIHSPHHRSLHHRSILHRQPEEAATFAHQAEEELHEAAPITADSNIAARPEATELEAMGEIAGVFKVKASEGKWVNRKHRA